MEHTTIPGLGSKVSRIGLGTWAIGGSFWGGTNEEEAIRTIEQALTYGINFIDTAPGYGNGVSETIVGKALKKYGKRDQIIIASKCGLNLDNNSSYRDLRKEFIKKEVENSLKRLQVDHIDLYQVHWPDPKTPIAETAEALKKLMEEGKVKAIGVSNCSVDEIKQYKKSCKLSTVQSLFNLFERESESAVFPFCSKEHLAMIAYSPICRGLLSGKMSKNRKFVGDDLRKSSDAKFQEPQFSQYLECVEALKKWGMEKYQRPLIALAMRWILDKNVNIALWGARRPDQLENLDKIEGWHLTQNDFNEIDGILQKYVRNPVGSSLGGPPLRND